MRIEHIDWRSFEVDLERFQGRGAAHARTIVAAIAKTGWRVEKGGLFHTWPDPEVGRLFVLDGHSRLAGLRKLEESTVFELLATLPDTVLTAVHGLPGDEAIKLARELNASAVPFTPSEIARIVMAERKDLAHLRDREAWEVLHERFPRYTPHELAMVSLYAYLPAELGRLLDNEELHPMAARALGRFVRDTEVDAETITRIGLQYVRSGHGPKILRKFLQVARETIDEIAVNGDLFGDEMVSRLDDVKNIRSAREELQKERRKLAGRRDVFQELEGTPAKANRPQRELLKADEKRDERLARKIERIEERHKAVTQFNAD